MCLTERKNKDEQTIYYYEVDFIVCGKTKRVSLFSSTSAEGRKRSIDSMKETEHV